MGSSCGTIGRADPTVIAHLRFLENVDDAAAPDDDPETVEDDQVVDELA